MPSIKLTTLLKTEYDLLFKDVKISNNKIKVIDQTVSKILKYKKRYELVSDVSKIPWYFVTLIHNMESSLNFKKYLHNGDPLTGCTYNVPEGRPVNGDPPFTWEESAADALKLQRLSTWQDWSISGILFQLEKYNGWGYRKKHPEVLSPYLWSFSNNYISGKYVADGRWSNSAVSRQCGAAVILRRMYEQNLLSEKQETIIKSPVLKFSNKKIPYAIELQTFLNNFPNIYLLTDGIPGKKTSAAFKQVSSYYLIDDSRNNES